MRIKLEEGYCLKHKETKKFLNDSDEFVELPQIFKTRSLAVQTKNVSSFGDQFRVKGVEKVLIVEE